MDRELHKGDCVLVTDKDNGLPKTLYYITSVSDDWYEAYAVYVGEESLQALDFPQPYTKEVSEYAYPVSLDVLNQVREEMADWIEDTRKLIPKQEGKASENKVVGHVYTNGHNLYKLTELKDGHWHYQLFVMNSENICVFERARGDMSEEDMAACYPVSEDVVQAIYSRLHDFIAKVNDGLSELVKAAGNQN